MLPTCRGGIGSCSASCSQCGNRLLTCCAVGVERLDTATAAQQVARGYQKCWAAANLHRVPSQPALTAAELQMQGKEHLSDRINCPFAESFGQRGCVQAAFWESHKVVKLKRHKIVSLE